MKKIKYLLKQIRELKRKIFFIVFRYPRYKFLPISLFRHINIQTNNRCTRRCHFCYYGIIEELPPLELMSESLFKKIISELVELNFKGRISLYEINEPMTDKRIYKFLSYIKEKLPEAFQLLVSNGDLLTKDKAEKLFDNGLDELRVNCYSKDEVKKNIELVKYLKNKGYRAKIIKNYKATEWDSRGGHIKEYYRKARKAPCELVYKQIIIKPSGKVGSCINDFFDVNVMGDTNKQTLKEIWFGDRFERLRKQLINKKRQYAKLCSQCDYVGYGGFINRTK